MSLDLLAWLIDPNVTRIQRRRRLRSPLPDKDEEQH